MTSRGLFPSPRNPGRMSSGSTGAHWGSDCLVRPDFTGLSSAQCRRGPAALRTLGPEWVTEPVGQEGASAFRAVLVAECRGARLRAGCVVRGAALRPPLLAVLMSPPFLVLTAPGPWGCRLGERALAHWLQGAGWERVLVPFIYFVGVAEAPADPGNL